MNEPLLAKLRYKMPAEFTTSEFKDEANKHGVSDTEAQDTLNHMIKRGFIKREKVGHYKKTDRYAKEV